MDVTPLSLGIETVGRVMSVIIPRNTHIPCVRKHIYTTEEDYQTAVRNGGVVTSPCRASSHVDFETVFHPALFPRSQQNTHNASNVRSFSAVGCRYYTPWLSAPIF